jgi:tRNA-dihydrouridine synthase B
MLKQIDAIPTFMIGSIPITGVCILSPMDGFSDHPYRVIVRKMGSPFVYAEFINAMDVIYRQGYIEKKLSFDEVERPIAFQLFDNDPERILKAALILRQKNPDFIDINMGCAEKAVSGRGAGSGLLKEPDKIATIFRLLTKELDIPITGKIRLGWDADHKNYLEIARIIEDNGGKMIAVHARTRKQYFDGKADWDAIAEVKQAVSIPVLGNGDVHNYAEAIEMRTKTGCDGVLIGRSAIGNPWVFSDRFSSGIDNNELINMIKIHITKMVDFYGEPNGIIRFRKHLTRYLRLCPEVDRNSQKVLLGILNLSDFLRVLTLCTE